MPKLDLKGTIKEIIQQCEDILKDAEEKAEVCPACHVKPKLFVNQRGEPALFACICTFKSIGDDPDLYYRDYLQE